MEKRWALLKSSDGARGSQGKRKIYEIQLEGAVLTCRWGMAEKAQRQTSVRVFRNEQAAMAAAYEKLYAKLDGGYAIAYAV